MNIKKENHYDINHVDEHLFSSTDIYFKFLPLFQAQEQLKTYQNKFDYAKDNRIIKIHICYFIFIILNLIISLVTGNIYFFVISVFFPAWIITNSISDNSHNRKFISLFRKGQQYYNTLDEAEHSLIPLISSSDFQINILEQLKITSEKLSPNSNEKFNQSWLMFYYNELKGSFNKKEYSVSFAIIGKLHDYYYDIHEHKIIL